MIIHGEQVRSKVYKYGRLEALGSSCSSWLSHVSIDLEVMNLMTSTYLFLQPKPSEVQRGCITQGRTLDKSTVNIRYLINIVALARWILGL